MLAAGLGLAGCSGGGGASDSSEGAPPVAVEEAYAASDGGAGPAPAVDPWTVPVPGSDQAERHVIQTGWVWLTSTDPVEVSGGVVDLVEAEGGRIDELSSVTRAEGRHPSAQLTVRVPADRLAAVIDDLADLAEVVESQVTAQDVTGTVVDLEARIRAKELSIERLEALLSGARTTADIIEAEQILTERQTELEQLLTQRSGLADAVAMATLTIQIAVPSEVPITPEPGFLGGLARGWDTLSAAVTGGLVALGFLIPWLALALLVAGGIVLVRRGRRAPVVAEGPSVAGPSAQAAAPQEQPEQPESQQTPQQ